MNRIFCFVLVFIISLTCMPVVASGADITVSAESAVVMIAHTGQIVYEKNAYEKRGMASTTKIMSSVVALEYGKLYSRINASLDDINVEGTSLGLKEGDSIDLLSLVSGMLISSGNDSANVTATLVGGGKSGFVKLMNLKARELGMDSTQFMNPSGLTEEGHYSTAYDMALLGSYAIKNPIFRTICSSKKRVVSFGDPVSEREIYNHNRFLDMYEGAFGIKTGFTKASGRCLVTAAERNGVVLVAVTLNAPDDWNDHIKLMDYGFSRVKLHAIEVECPCVDVVGADKSSVKTRLTKELCIPYCGDIPSYTKNIYTDHFVYGSLRENDYLGYVEVSFSDTIIMKTYLVSEESANAIISETSERTFIEKLKEFLRKGLS